MFLRVPLSDIIKPVERPEIPIPGVTYRQIGVRLWGEGAYERETIDGGETKYKTLSRMEENDIVVNKIWARNGSVALVTEPLAGTYGSGEFPTFTPIKNYLEPRWFHWLTKTKWFWDQCDLKSRGTSGKNRIRPEKFLQIEIPLPPLPEQRRIVAKIEELAAKIREAFNLREIGWIETRSLFQSTVTYLCHSYKYPIFTFGEVLLEAKNGIYKPPHYWGRGIPCIRMYNIDGPRMNKNNLQYLEVTKEELDIYGCKPGDLIFNRVNSAELVGKTGIITGDYSTCTFESKNMRLRVNLSQTIPEYAVLILNSVQTKQFYRDVLKQQCGMATLNQNHVSRIPYPLPPLDEQRRIVAYLDGLQAKVDALKKLQTQTATELDALLPSILDRAFKGNL